MVWSWVKGEYYHLICSSDWMLLYYVKRYPVLLMTMKRASLVWFFTVIRQETKTFTLFKWFLLVKHKHGWTIYIKPVVLDGGCPSDIYFSYWLIIKHWLTESIGLNTKQGECWREESERSHWRRGHVVVGKTGCQMFASNIRPCRKKYIDQ